MVSIFRSNFLNRYPIDAAMQEFGRQFDVNAKILDIGCGSKPYKKYFSGAYTGVDHSANSAADIIADSAAIPLPDHQYDAVILNQTLEHTEHLADTIKEIKRLLKPNGFCFISVPFIMKVHSEPQASAPSGYQQLGTEQPPYWHVDYWRFTKYGLVVLFKDFNLVSLQETSGYITTICQMINYFFSSFGLTYLFIPLYLLNNIFGLAADSFFGLCLKANNPLFNKFYRLIYMSAPLNYILIIQKNDQ